MSDPTTSYMCRRCGAQFPNLDETDITLMIRGVKGTSDGALWFHGSPVQVDFSQQGQRLEVWPRDGEAVAPGALKGFCGPVEIEAYVAKLDWDSILGHVRASLFRALPGDTAMAVMGRIEALKAAALSARDALSAVNAHGLSTPDRVNARRVQWQIERLFGGAPPTLRRAIAHSRIEPVVHIVENTKENKPRALCNAPVSTGEVVWTMLRRDEPNPEGYAMCRSCEKRTALLEWTAWIDSAAGDVLP